MSRPVIDIQKSKWQNPNRNGSSVVGCNMLGNYKIINPLRNSLSMESIQTKYQDRFYKLSWTTGKLMKNDPVSLLTAFYDPTNGNISLKFTGHGSIDINHFRMLSPSQIMSEDTATLPSATYTILNNDAGGLYGVGSELYFYTPDITTLSLNDSSYGISDTYNLGNICPADLTQDDIDSSFVLTPADSNANIKLFGYFAYYIFNASINTYVNTFGKIKVIPLNIVDGGGV